MASYCGLLSRPGGLSDEEEEDDDYPVVEMGGQRRAGGFSYEDDDDNEAWKLKASKVTESQQCDESTAKMSTASISTFSPQQGALGRGRGRGRGILQLQQHQIQVESSGKSLEERGHSWGGPGGLGRGRTGRHRRQRSRSGSSSPSRSDKQKLKEALLKRVPDFGGAADSFGREREEMLWAKEVSRNLKFWWEQDQKIKTAKEFQTSKEAKLEMSLVNKLSGDGETEEDCNVGGGK